MSKKETQKPSNGLNRRQFLKRSAAAAGIAMLGPSMAACGDGSTNNTLQPVRGDGSDPLDYIEHVVILQMENRSFDHYFASLVLDEGRTDITAMGRDHSNPSARKGVQIPIDRLSDNYIISPDPPHSWEPVHKQWNNGANDQFVNVYEDLIHSNVTGRVRDKYEKPIKADVAAEIREMANADIGAIEDDIRAEAEAELEANQGDENYEDQLEKLIRKKTKDATNERVKEITDAEYDDRFNAKWEEVKDDFEAERNDEFDAEYDKRVGYVMGYYQREQLPIMYALADNFTLCDHWFSGLLGPTWPNRYMSMCATSQGSKANDYTVDAKTPYYDMVKQKGLTVQTYALNELFCFSLLTPNIFSPKKGLGISPKHIEDFYDDCRNGTLPNVAIVEPDYALNDDHPPQDVTLGESFIASVYEAVINSPQWERTLMLVYYDEHGGFYDSVKPPAPNFEENPEFQQLGFRVPGLLISPLTKPGYVMKDVVEHASVPSLISRIFGVDHVNERSRQAGTFANAFDLERIDGSKRQAPPSMKQVEIPHSKIRAALQQPHGQPELVEHCMRIHGQARRSMSERLQAAENHFRRLEAMRVARVTD